MKRCLIVIRAPDGPIDSDQMAAARDNLARLVKGKADLMVNSKLADLVGILVTANRSPRQMVAKVRKAFNFTDTGPVLAVEIDEDFAAIANTAGWHYLQH